jgi:hypothetical protein
MQKRQDLLAQDEWLHTLTNADESAYRGQPILALHIGSQQDSGIQRKYRPNEDTLIVMRGAIPAASTSLRPTSFVLLLVADERGGQGHGRTASRLASGGVVGCVHRDASCGCLRSRPFIPTMGSIAQTGKKCHVAFVSISLMQATHSFSSSHFYPDLCAIFGKCDVATYVAPSTSLKR